MARLHREQRSVTTDDGGEVLFAAEGSAGFGLDDSAFLFGQIGHERQRMDEVVRALHGAANSNARLRRVLGDDSVIFDVELLLRSGAVLTFDDIDEMIDRANSSPYGLAAAVWTSNLKKAHAVSRRLKAGTVWINTYGLMDAALPFGVYKSSGFGRELGAHAIEHYTELKTVWLNMGQE